MKVAIVGAGKLGMAVTNTLLGGDHAVTIIDTDESLLQRVSSHIDVLTVTANAKEVKALRNIGISSYDFLIATTDNDETNLVICSFAKKLGCGKVIARVRDPEHMQQIQFIKDLMGVDYIINPDLEITNEIYKYLVEKYTLSNGIFSSGKISLLEFKASKHKALIDLPITEFSTVLPGMLAVGISRNGKVIIPHGDDVIKKEDYLYVVGERDPIQALSKKVHERGKYTDLQKVMIMGGGKTGFYLAKRLSDYGASVKIVEKDKGRCFYLSTHLNDVMVLNGDATDLQLLEEENFEGMDAVVTCTGFDEDNLLLALSAKQHGIEDVIAKVSRRNYAEIISAMGIDMALNPIDIVTSIILRLVQGNKKVLSSQLIQGQAEIMEVYATPHMDILGVPLKDLDLPLSVIIAAIHRGNQVIIPNGDTVIEEDDRLLMLSLISDIASTEKLLKDSSKLGFFRGL